jgi:superoxide dismutase, Cu-Zn family
MPHVVVSRATALLPKAYLSTWHRSCKCSYAPAWSRRRNGDRFPEREREAPGNHQRKVALPRLGRGILMNLHSTRTYSIAGRFAIASLLWASLTLPASLDATAQDSTPMATPENATAMAAAQRATPMAATRQATPIATPTAVALDVPLIDANGDAVGLATFTENADGVTVHLLVEGLSPGEHGWHLHEFGVCDPNGDEPFSSAGGHWNPTSQPHGAPDADEHHVGDFGNLVASADGLAEIEITTSDFTFEAGQTSVFDEDGTSIVVHEGPDDLGTQPSGNSGPRYACGVVAEPTIDMTAMQAATPMATPMSMVTPMTMATPITMATPEDAGATPTS